MSEKLRLLDFWAPWCGPCMRMTPIIDEVEKETRDWLDIQRINVDENPDKASKFNVMAIPTYILLREEEVIARALGGMPKREFLGFLNKNRAQIP